MKQAQRPLLLHSRVAAFGLFLAFLANPAPAHARRGVWTSFGPDGGDVCALAVDSSNPLILYAGTHGEVFKSTDGGTHWYRPYPNPILGTEYYLPFCMLTVDPKRPSTIYAASDYQGLVKTVDGGRTWRRLSAGLPPLVFKVWDIAVDPRNPSILYAGTSDGVYFSRDGGATWRLRLRDAYSAVTAIETDPIDRLVYAVWGFGVYRSGDQGRSWTRARNGLPHSASIRSLAIDPKKPKTLLAATDQGLHRTTNRGRRWARVAPHLINGAVSAVVFESYTGIAYAATQVGAVFRSADGGASWSRTSGDPSDPWILTLAASPDALYAGTAAVYRPGGVFRSPDAGATWERSMWGISTLSIQAFAVDPSASSTQYAASHEGLAKTEDGGKSWSSLDIGTPPGFGTEVVDIAIHPLNPASVYVTSRISIDPFLRSDDGGDTWRQLSVPEFHGSHVVLEPDPRAPNALWAATIGGSPVPGGLFHSVDGGTTWTRQGISATEIFGIDVIRLNPGNPETVCAAGIAYTGTAPLFSAVPRIFCTTDGGRSWERRSTGALNIPSADLILDPSDPAALYVLNQVGLFRSLDNGGSWRLVLRAPGAATATPSPPFVLYASSGHPSAGVLCSTDRGETWTQIGNGLVGHSVGLLAVDPQNPARLYAGTRDGGLFTYTVP